MDYVKTNTNLSCEYCKAQNAWVIWVGGEKEGDKYILCPRCLTILEELEEEYREICLTDGE